MENLLIFSSVGSDFDHKYIDKVFSSWNISTYDSACVIYDHINRFNYTKYFKYVCHNQDCKFPNLFYFIDKNANLLDRYKYIAVLDDDLVFTKTNTLDVLTKSMQKHDISIMSPGNTNKDKTTYHKVMFTDLSSNSIYITNFCEMGCMIIETKFLLLIKYVYEYLENPIKDFGFDYFICHLANFFQKKIGIHKYFGYINPTRKDERDTFRDYFEISPQKILKPFKIKILNTIHNA